MTLQFSNYRTITLAACLALLIASSSCYSYRVATHAQAGSELSKPVTVQVDC